MAITCRMITQPGGKVLCYTGAAGDTYEIALLSFRIIPDTVLILHHGVSLPQDKPIEENEVEIILTREMGSCCCMGWETNDEWDCSGPEESADEEK